MEVLGIKTIKDQFIKLLQKSLGLKVVMVGLIGTIIWKDR
jgi:hypothetical protein